MTDKGGADQQGAELMELRISETSDWQLFDVIAQTLEQGLKGSWVKKLDGLAFCSAHILLRAFVRIGTATPALLEAPSKLLRTESQP